MTTPTAWMWFRLIVTTIAMVTTMWFSSKWSCFYIFKLYKRRYQQQPPFWVAFACMVVAVAISVTAVRLLLGLLLGLDAKYGQ